ncbi:hypothetical protein [Mediterraneibacter glycyrrhizinilyticus]|uniref:hypothetical protein n=1 Tax=Mediterraneibacter glycyrrhizinilyticus TaxID=342942 RepID=UPI0025A39D72|nr:hypothetical protein [Mediterraneibacter glycyrrhizinilyticus]MDM8126234.1 hypothetical protein [Mediterraneibacter glycyrrhizinilyticus]
MKIELIHNITSELIDEIETNANYKEGTSYNVDYFSLPSDYIVDPVFQDKIETYGAHYLLFYLYLKTQMLNSGRYYIYADCIYKIMKTYCVLYSANFDDIEQIFEDLKNSQTIVCVCGTLLGNIITDPYIVYNYRLTMERRSYNRNKKREERQNARIPSAPSAPVNSSSTDPFIEEFLSLGSKDLTDDVNEFKF